MRRRIDVETTSCVYWIKDILRLPQHLKWSFFVKIVNGQVLTFLCRANTFLQIWYQEWSFSTEKCQLFARYFVKSNLFRIWNKIFYNTLVAFAFVLCQNLNKFGVQIKIFYLSQRTRFSYLRVQITRACTNWILNTEYWTNSYKIFYENRLYIEISCLFYHIVICWFI